MNRIGWFFYRFTPRGRDAWKLKKGLEGLKHQKALRTVTKIKVVHSANEMLKSKKILAFHKGKSIFKPKKSDHEVRESVKSAHREELDQRGIEITKSGKFRNA